MTVTLELREPGRLAVGVVSYPKTSSSLIGAPRATAEADFLIGVFGTPMSSLSKSLTMGMLSLPAARVSMAFDGDDSLRDVPTLSLLLIVLITQVELVKVWDRRHHHLCLGTRCLLS